MMTIFRYIAGCFKEAESLKSRNCPLKLHEGRFRKENFLAVSVAKS